LRFHGASSDRANHPKQPFVIVFTGRFRIAADSMAFHANNRYAGASVEPQTNGSKQSMTTTNRQPIKLTTKAVSTLKSKGKKQRDWFDTVVRGLSLRVTETGKKSWTLQYRIGKTKRRWTIGVADENHGGISLASARRKAKSALTALRDHGIDPADVKSANRKAKTFSDLVESFLKERAGKKSIGEYERVLNKHFLPNWKHRAAKDITKYDVGEIIQGIADKKKPVAANRALAYVSAVFTFGVQRHEYRLETNPAWKIERAKEPAKVTKGRKRVLSDDEIRELFTALDACTTLKRAADNDETGPTVAPMIARGLKTILLTAQRPGEVFNMRWQDINRDESVWTIPATMTKNGTEHRVPLTKQVLELLDEAQADAPADNRYVFAGDGGASVAARAKKALSALRTAGAITYNDVHRHDLRRTAATLMEADGIPVNHIARVLNHNNRQDIGRVTTVYARHPYDAEKRVALETLARRIDTILAAKPATVVPFAR